MSTTIGEIRAAIKTALAANTVAGGYHYDLTGSDQVMQGWVDRPPRAGLAHVMVAHWDVTIEPGQPLTQNTNRATFFLEASAPTTVDTSDARTTAAEQLASDVLKCLRKATIDTGGGIRAITSAQVTDLTFDVEPLPTLDGEIFEWAQVAIKVTFTYRLSVTGGL